MLDLVTEVGREFTDVMFAVTDQLQQLHLTDNETFLLKAYVIFDGTMLCYVILYYTTNWETINRTIYRTLSGVTLMY